MFHLILSSQHCKSIWRCHHCLPGSLYDQGTSCIRPALRRPHICPLHTEDTRMSLELPYTHPFCRDCKPDFSHLQRFLLTPDSQYILQSKGSPTLNHCPQETANLAGSLDILTLSLLHCRSGTCRQDTSCTFRFRLSLCMFLEHMECNPLLTMCNQQCTDSHQGQCCPRAPRNF